jgi:hypothetical protein
MPGGPAIAAIVEAPEEKIKGEFVGRFPLFVEWPPQAFPTANDRFVVCVAGDGPVADYVLGLARSRRWKGREAVGRRLGAKDDPTRCHLLFIALPDGDRLAELLAATAGRSVLTVGDAPGLASRGVLINLFREGEHVRFEMNVDMISQSPLKFDGQLLHVARPTHSRAK